MGIDDTLEVSQAEWAPLQIRGIDLRNISEIVTLSDQTLAYKGRRVLVYIRDQFLKEDGSPKGYRFHLAECSTLQQMRKNNRAGRYVATNRRDGMFIVNEFSSKHQLENSEVEREIRVCMNCLRTLDWKRYQGQPQKRNSIWNEFRIEHFFEEFRNQVSPLPATNEYNAPLNVYPPHWGEISSKYKTRVDWTCERCRVYLSQENFREYLHVHHKDGLKSNGRPQNLQALCVECHSQEPHHEQLTQSSDYAQFRSLLESGRLIYH